jgi:signal transduction histidine kinase
MVQVSSPSVSGLLECLPVGILAFDRDGWLVQNNRKAIEFLDLHVAELITIRCEELIPHSSFQDAVECVRNGSEETRRITIQRENTVYTVVISKRLDSGGEQSGIVVMLEDVTRLKSAETIAHDFIGTLLHRFRNPLTTLTTTFSMLHSGKIPPADPSINEIFGMSFHEINRLNILVADLRTLFYIESGLIDKEIEMERVPVSTVLSRAISDVSKHSETLRSAKERIDLSGDTSSTVRADFDILKLILFHVLCNALLYSPFDARVEVIINRENDQVFLTVADNGFGIPDAERPRIFDKFYRGNSSPAMNVEGNGLGLYLARSLIEHTGGSIYCEKRKERGMSFTLSLGVYNEKR